ncbi:MAG: N-acetylmuramoyl-L-alanine amidase [Armatimonadota bacterium]|nr:N-acetylmuramoyl-L-alanine amidase [Armatimonadota bacterium]
MGFVRVFILVIVLLGTAFPGLAQGRTISVVVNGQPVRLEAPPFLLSGQVMIPAGAAFEAFGAAATWFAEKQAIVISNRTGLTLTLRPNEPVVLVNGEQRAIPIAPVLRGDRPFVPAQVVFSLLGAWVKFEEREGVLHVASQVLGVSPEQIPEGLRLIVDATGPVQVQTQRLSNPERLVLDLVNAANRVQEREINVQGGGVLRIRISQFQVKPYITRMVLDLAQPVTFQVTNAIDTFRIVVEVNPLGPATPPSSLSPAPDFSAALKVNEVRYEEGKGSRVVISANRAMPYTISEFVFPHRIAVDIQGAIFPPVRQVISVKNQVVTYVRAAQFMTNPEITRIVVTLRRKVPYVVRSEAGGTRLIVELEQATTRSHVVALDPGHGGKDPGAIGPTGLKEAEVVLDIALRTRDLLTRDGVKVVMTRDRDVFVEVVDRPRIAREQGATIYISIHANASVTASVSGSETYYNTPQSLALAQMIQEELTRALGLPSRGIKTANFYVIRDNTIPSVLVEVAFISSPAEEKLLRSPEVRQKIAIAIYKGILRFLEVYPVPAGH